MKFKMPDGRELDGRSTDFIPCHLAARISRKQDQGMDDVSRVVRPESLASTHNGFLDFFRCPPEFARFQISKEPCSEEGFFRFGQAICYGKSSAGQLARTPRQTLFDASWATESDQSRISLCFDPTQVAENLRREHYLLAGGGQRLLRSLYYLARPALAFPL